VIYGLVRLWVPNVAEAFEDYNFRRSAVLLTRLDVEVLRAMMRRSEIEAEQIKGMPEPDAVNVAEEFGWLDRREDGTLKDNRERVEFEGKCARLGMECPWIKGETR